MDEVMVWNRALTPSEIQDVYNLVLGSAGTTVTTISAKGYNICDVNNLRTVEREIEINYEE